MKGAQTHGPRNGKVVQPGQGLRVHNPRRGGRGPLRALLRYSGQRVQNLRGGREGHLRGGPGPEGSAGPKRLQGVSASSAAADTDLMAGSHGVPAIVGGVDVEIPARNLGPWGATCSFLGPTRP